MDRILPRPVAYLTALLLGVGVIAMLWAAFRDRPEEVGLSEAAPMVIVDAGHGGEDGGTVVFGIKEKDIVLDTALRLERELLKRGVRVEMTRRDDSTLSLAGRVALARRHPGAAFVSIHLNRFASPKVRGAEVYIATPEVPVTLRLEPGDKGRPYRDGRSAELGRRILEEIGLGTSIPTRDVRESRMYVAREAPAPSVLIECGYLSNPADAMILSKAEGRTAMAKAIATACDRFFRETRDNRLLGWSPWSTQTASPEIAGPEGEP